MFFSIILLLSTGGAIGGMASTIAQKHKGKAISYSFLLENMAIGAIISIAMFFILKPHISPDFFEKRRESEDIGILELDNLLLPLQEEPEDCLTILSIAIGLGSVGTPLMDALSKQLLSRFSDDEKNDSS